MRRRFFGWALILHGLAHASAGMWAGGADKAFLSTALWEVAATSFILAGAGVLGASWFRAHWRALIGAGGVSSLLMLTVFGHPMLLPGVALDVVAMLIALSTLQDAHAEARPIRPVWRGLLLASAVYVAAVIGLRPWYTTWGSTESERTMRLIGDPQSAGPMRYRIDHAITVNAPPEAVWPWLIQMGQDRAGFYSYDRLERAIGARIYNADRIVPEWQYRKVGDLVPATQPGYLRGIVGANPGWRITAIEPGRAIVLQGWGAFVLHPMGDSTRLHVRTRGDGAPTLSGVMLSPIGLLVFEPAHFIMQRGMLIGIKRRAERASVVLSSVTGVTSDGD